MGKELTIVIPNIEDIILKMARKFKRLLVLFKVKKSLGIIRKTQVSGFGSAMKVELTSTHFLDDSENLISGTYTKIDQSNSSEFQWLLLLILKNQFGYNIFFFFFFCDFESNFKLHRQFYEMHFVVRITYLFRIIPKTFG